MQEVPDDVLNQHIFPYLGILDKVALSGVNKRFHTLLCHISKEWTFYDEPFIKAVLINDMSLVRRFRSTASNDTFIRMLAEASRAGHVETTEYLDSYVREPLEWENDFDLCYCYWLRIDCFLNACVNRRLPLALKMIEWGWVTHHQARYRAKQYGFTELLELLNARGT